MQYRLLSGGDYTLGKPFLANSPACVGQAVLTRLKLFLGEWFVDTSDGTPWLQSILGKQTGGNPDAYIKQRILGTPGVSSIVSYSGGFNGSTRKYTVSVSILTVYSTTVVTVSTSI